ncbi:MAG TPA: hypothetical protein PLQ93_05155 [Bacteroidia bacterium]|nr:hypothetical protein [Bacteroidia bacterium]
MSLNFLIFFFVFFEFASQTLQAQHIRGEDFLKQVHGKYFKGPCRYYSFSQRNKHYRNDSLIRTSEWHEAIGFPDQFRIHFGDKAKGNFVWFRNDSALNYRDGKFLKARSDSNSLLLILGGMFYRDFEDVLLRLKAAGYNTTTLCEKNWMGKPVYVLGARENDENANQIWFDKENLRVLRIIENLSAIEQMDMRFEKLQTWCHGYMETKVSFRRNGKLEQEEEYYNIKEEERFPD